MSGPSAEPLTDRIVCNVGTLSWFRTLVGECCRAELCFPESVTLLISSRLFASCILVELPRDSRRPCHAAGDPGGGCTKSEAMPAFHELRLISEPALGVRCARCELSGLARSHSGCIAQEFESPNPARYVPDNSRNRLMEYLLLEIVFQARYNILLSEDNSIFKYFIASSKITIVNRA